MNARERSAPATRQNRPPAKRIQEPPPTQVLGKMPELARCPRCFASYREGRWTWRRAPMDAYEHRCPACERIETDYPAGVVQLTGSFVAPHLAELVGLMRGVEEREKKEHPLKRIIDIVTREGGVTVRTTDGKLAEALGRALFRAYEGNLETPETREDPANLVRIRWTRD